VTKLFLSNRALASDYFGLTADHIPSTQSCDGAIPWFEGGPVDPWDHVEAAMGLSIAGYRRAAERAYLWLRKTQLPDGSWPAQKTTWTAGVVLMTADALTGYTPGARLFVCPSHSLALASPPVPSGALLSG
jgi:hypothetical protein